MANVVILLATALSSAIVTVMLARRYDRLLTLKTAADSVHLAKCSDGHRVALHRYKPDKPRAGELPVVLCHGLGANRFNLDFDESYSFARYLRGRGYDVFVVELRQFGSFDDLVEKDVPAILDEVQAVTGSPKVNWVGHSLGGMIAYAALGGPCSERIYALATLGTPATFAHHKWLRRLARAYFLVRYSPARLSPWLARTYAPFSPYLPLPMGALGNRRNFDKRVLQQVLWNVVSVSSPGVTDQLVKAIRKGCPACLSTQQDPEAHFKTIGHPVLMIAGAADSVLAPPAAVRHAYDAVASEDKQLVVLSKKNGFSADYGHGDLVLGKNAPTEVFPIVERFLWKNRRASLALKAAGGAVAI